MSVSLQWITPDAERVIVDCARVSSNPDAAKRPDANLLCYLMRHKHWSPFDMTGRLSMVKRSHRPDPCAAVIDAIRAYRDEVRA